MRVVALFRVSTEKQEQQGSSLESQEREYDVLAAKEGWTTVGRFRGSESASGASKDRVVLQQVLACVREKEPEAVYVHEQSRLTRGDELEVAMLMRELRERKVKIIVHGTVRDLGSIDERFMVGIQSLVDRAESERIKERMTRGKREKAKRGLKTCGPAPYGYRNPPPGDPKRGKLQVDPERAPVVRRIFELAGAGKGDQAISVALNEAGYRARRGGLWGKSSVRKVLENVAYLGTSAANVWVDTERKRSFRLNLKNDRAILIDNAHDPIIDRVQWDAVHGRAKLPRTIRPRMLSGILWVNGKYFHGDSSRHGTFYRSERGKGLKGEPWLLADQTDRAVWAAFASLATGPEFVERIMAEAQSPHDRMVTEQEIEHLEDHIAKARRRLDNLLEMRADGEIDKATFQAKSEEAKRGIESKAAEADALRAKLASTDGTVATRVANAVRVILRGCSRLTADQRRTLLRTLVRKVEVTAERKKHVDFARDAAGRVTGSGGPRWAIAKVHLRLALPEADAKGGLVGPHAGNGGANGSETSQSGDGQLVTTACPSAQLPVTDGDGYLGTTD